MIMKTYAAMNFGWQKKKSTPWRQYVFAKANLGYLLGGMLHSNV
jgi:hypothetical protein